MPPNPVTVDNFYVETPLDDSGGAGTVHLILRCQNCSAEIELTVPRDQAKRLNLVSQVLREAVERLR